MAWLGVMSVGRSKISYLFDQDAGRLGAHDRACSDAATRYLVINYAHEVISRTLAESDMSEGLGEAEAPADAYDD